MSKVPTALTIAGSDPCSGAGIQSDLLTFQNHHVYGVNVITTQTIQNTTQVFSNYSLPVDLIKDQLINLLNDIQIDGIKFGMITSSEAIIQISQILCKYNIPLIIDPILKSSSGFEILTPTKVQLMIQHLFPLTTLITPNIKEAEYLTGQTISSLKDVENAAWQLANKYHVNVLIKGGHSIDPEEVTDVFYDGHHFSYFKSPRIKLQNVHGTGCALSAAITANIALGKNLITSIQLAKEYLTNAIKNSVKLGKGANIITHQNIR